MDDQYVEHCLADPVFYDDPGRAEGLSAWFKPATTTLPAGWRREHRGPWVTLFQPGALAVEQGWKVHLSASANDVERVVDVAVEYCLAHGIALKFLRDPVLAALANGKYANRRSSGKLVTIYPADDERLLAVLVDLADLLAGVSGPYVLSDLRWNDSCLFVRYGSFVERYCENAAGERVPALRGPDGDLVPDVRGTVFRSPPWAPVPDFLAEHVEAHGSQVADVDEFPFEVVEALHFSNGGGIYRAVDLRDGRTVVLREARPHAGLDAAGRDAVERLSREWSVLESLAGLDFVPEVYEHRTVWEHHFLVEEFIEGERLEDVFTRRCPLVHPHPTAEVFAEYTAWALDVLDQLDAALGALHTRGVVFGDLSPHNVLVRPDGRCALVDFEVSFAVGDDEPFSLGTPGFFSPSARRGADVDRFALAALRLYLFLPLNTMLHLDASKAPLAARTIHELYPVPLEYGAAVVADLAAASGGRLPTGSLGSESADWPSTSCEDAGRWRRVMDSLAAGIVASATPERDDRLFPGDVEQFASPGAALGLSCGAAGVLHALTSCGYSPPSDLECWLVDAVTCRDDVGIGLYDGLTGIAWALQRGGNTRDALRVLDRVVAAPDLPGDPGLHSGRAGVAYGLLHFGVTTGDGHLVDRALRIGHALRGLVQDGAGPRANGLMHGRTGLGALFLALHQHTGERDWLAAAESALLGEVAKADFRNGALHLRDDGENRLVPYLAAGGVGTGLVISAHPGAAASPDLVRALAAADRACSARLVAAPGLYEGRAGMIVYAASRPAGLGTEVLDRHLRDLSWHAVRYRGDLHFPGRRLHRLSVDLATGSAGVLVALHAATRSPVPLPGIGPPCPTGTEPTDLRPGRR
ncbi:class III lanthionine synthetase LanKC [Umezawaea endophytica]|uniref:non-specific serine/threonine protein kinase n=1 Tax=Umezawaea endophytica TaxID=1654476 RepID=A0A9X2VUL0_9PSEU|nr:class III lanthionine synthetase LanKC [Umezawaea endophytica]MCS7482482.1 class III lanthionine synthetase LanKC [Umezawaea endophytica]